MYSLKKYGVVLGLLVCWLIVQFFLFEWHHIKVMNDSHRYLEYAQDIVYNGISWQPHNRWYLGYVLFLSGFVKLGLSLFWVVATQVLLSLGAIIMLSVSVAKAYGKNAGCIVAFLIIAWFKISEWNYYLLTESLYVSGVMVMVSLLISFRQKRVLLYIIFGVFFFLLRPTSVLFFGSIVITCLWLLKSKGYKKEVLLVISLGLIGGYFVLNKMLESFIIVEAMERREAIFAYCTNPNFPMWDWVVFDVEKKLDYPSEERSQIIKMFLFVVYNPIFFLKLSLAKLLYFYGNVKPYFSWQHNVLIVMFLWSAYGFMIKGYRSLKKVHQIFLLSYLLLNGIMIVLCSADWDGRFLIPVLPVVFIGTSVGLVNQFSFLNKSNSKPKDLV